MRQSLAVLALLSGLTIVGCAPPTLDSSDLRKSTEKVRESVEYSQQDEFDLAMDQVRRASQGEVRGTEPFSVDGMTADDVFAEAQRIELRSEIAWAEASIETERQLVDARERLEAVAVREFRTHFADGRVSAKFEVTNGLASPIDTAWLRIEASKPGYPTAGGEDAIAFRPPLAPGETREAEFVVTSSAVSALPPDDGTTVSVRITLIERAGDILLQEPSEAVLDEAKLRLAAAEDRLAELRSQLPD